MCSLLESIRFERIVLARNSKMAKIPIALQLYSVREDCARDLPATLKAVADMGYEGVEFAGYHGRNAAELKTLLQSTGLRSAGTHVYIGTLLGDELQKTIHFNHTLDNEFLIVPWLPEERGHSKAEWLKTAHLMNTIAEKLKPEGMRLGYHNHAVEFQPMDGELPWNLFFDATRPDVVMQLDTGNAMQAGISPDGILEIIKKYPRRIATVHLKEYSSKNEQALIGEGEMKWQEFLKLCATIGGTEWYIVEQEVCFFPRMECLRRDIENLRKML